MTCVLLPVLPLLIATQLDAAGTLEDDQLLAVLVFQSLLFTLVKLGFAFLTVSLITGFFFVTDLFAQHLAHKTILTMAALGVFALLLLGRWRFGWRGRRAAIFAIIGFGFLLFTFFGVNLFLSGEHSFRNFTGQ